MRILPWLLAVTLLPVVSACEIESVDCRPTVTDASDAAKVDVAAPTGSAVLTARVTADGDGVDAVTVRFELLDGGAVLSDVTAQTGNDGTAKVDLKNELTVQDLAGLARADGFRASFGGNGTFCSSSGDAEVSTAGGVSLP